MLQHVGIRTTLIAVTGDQQKDYNMSVDATVATWKLKKKQVTPTQKLILLSYADRADEYAECWPSNRRLEEDTGLDRHTICENKQKLLAASLISYTGEKKGRTKSVDVIRLNYVIHRESSEETPTAQNESSGEMPIPSSGEMPTAKQWGNAHTEPNTLLNLTEEPKTTTTCSSDSFLNYKPQDDERTDDEFLAQCKHHINNRDKTKYTEAQARSGLIKILKSGKFTKPAGYKAKTKETNHPTQADFQNYAYFLKHPTSDVPDDLKWIAAFVK